MSVLSKTIQDPARLMAYSVVVALVVVLLTLSIKSLGTRIAGNLGLASTPAVAKFPLQLPSKPQLLVLVNAERAKVGAPALQEDPRLDASATRKSNEMQKQGSPGTTPHLNAQGELTTDYIKQAWPQCTAGSEDLIWNATSAQAAITAWLNSPAHRESMLSGRYDYVGYGVTDNMIAMHLCSID